MNAFDNVQTPHDEPELEAINSGLAELLGDDELTADEADTVGTPDYWSQITKIPKFLRETL